MVSVTIATAQLNDLGMAIDFRVLKQTVHSVLSMLDHSDLNTLVAFRGKNPTTEALAQFVHAEMAKALMGTLATVVAVTLEETPNYSVTYSESD